ncbi:MAG: SDR family NAD(P)-dependent oxidoreductase [Candidatus Brevundimonas phytovorans]|nr:SDR family NAD(P)-dependent oxidoreductase [Brevundimonas sp.]WEK56740.1 MAG: SDR family NAD(P)-dependent oxidoreductase [Brevundimonas sp.]
MSNDRKAFEGGVAVITGAGAGLGEGLARRAATLGMAVVVADIDEARALAVAADITAAGGAASAVKVDVSRPEELDRLADWVYARHDEVRLLINNAGVETIGNSWELSTELWERTLDINIHGVIHGVRAFTPRMLASPNKSYIANLASVGAFGQMPLQTAYIVTKHAVQAFTECLYLELQLKGAQIQVSSIIPGMVKTRIFNDARPAADPQAARHQEVMRQSMDAYGMDLGEACQVILEQVADGAFWVSTQPDMTQSIAGNRARFLTEREAPALTAETRALLDA